ncbi:MAG: phosphatidylglycerol lysyltransferase domain-containing protein [Sulfitobacter sp.]
MNSNTQAVYAALRWTTPVAILMVCVWLLSRMIDQSLLAQLPALLKGLKAEVVVPAALLCTLSFWAVARYDGLAHRHFQTGVSAHAASQSGFAAIALAQTLGFGIVTGSAVRWRVLPDLRAGQAVQLSTFVTLTFMPALFFLAACSCLIFLPVGWWTFPATATVVVLITIVLLLSFAPLFAPLRNRACIPSLRAFRSILGWTALDVLTAGFALYLLIPTPELAFTEFLPVFLLALSAAMLSGAPGGVGPFELVLLGMMPQVPTVDLLAGICAFRGLYYAVPAILAVYYLINPLKSGMDQAPQGPHQPIYAPEFDFLPQNGGEVVALNKGAVALLPTAQSLVQMGDCLGHPGYDTKAFLKRTAADQGRLPLLYKCNAQTAVSARQQGWKVLRLSRDAIVPLASFDLELPCRRRLRRILRKATSAGVTAQHVKALPITKMAELDETWQANHGGARGATMGRFCPHYLCRQEVFVAYQGAELIAFVTFHRNADTLHLDLMRHAQSIPDGTMHQLVQTALEYAKVEGLEKVDLAAVPTPPKWMYRWPDVVARFAPSGLYQFKNSFAPKWQPRYAAAPGWPSLIIGLADIALAIQHPRALETQALPHNQDEDYELDMVTTS